jgi:hypothetical protein
MQQVFVGTHECEKVCLPEHRQIGVAALQPSLIQMREPSDSEGLPDDPDMQHTFQRHIVNKATARKFGRQVRAWRTFPDDRIVSDRFDGHLRCDVLLPIDSGCNRPEVELGCDATAVNDPIAAGQAVYVGAKSVCGRLQESSPRLRRC